MADLEFDIDEASIAEMMTKLDAVDASVNRGMNKVLRESSEPIKADMESNINRSDGSTHKYGEGHAADNVIISRAQIAGQGIRGENFVQIGFPPNIRWRMWFVIMGTVYQRPQFQIQNAIRNKSSEVLSIQEKMLRELIINRGLA